MLTREEAKQRQRESNRRSKAKKEALALHAEADLPRERFRRAEALEAVGEYTQDATTGFAEARRRSARRLAGRMLFEQLEGRERRVIEASFGLDGNEPLTFREIGKELGVSGSRAMQIGEKALRKLRHPFWREAVGEVFQYVREPILRDPTLRERDEWYRKAFKRRLDALYPNWRLEEARRRAEAMARIAADKNATDRERHEAIIVERRAYQEALIAAERNRIAEERAGRVAPAPASPPTPPPEVAKRPFMLADFTWKSGY